MNPTAWNKEERKHKEKQTDEEKKKKTPLQSLLIKVMVGVMGGKQSGIPPVKSIKHRYKIQVDALLMKTTVSQVSVCSVKGHKKNPLPLITRIERKYNQVVNRIREDLCCSVVYVLLQSQSVKILNNYKLAVTTCFTVNCEKEREII